jgi:hypothetical protein
MRKILPGLAVAFLAVTLLARDSTGQTANLNAELLNDWTAQKALMMKIADAMPEDKFSYKSTPPQRDPHVGHLRSDGRLPEAERHHAARQPEALMKTARFVRSKRMRSELEPNTSAPFSLASCPPS